MLVELITLSLGADDCGCELGGKDIWDEGTTLLTVSRGGADWAVVSAPDGPTGAACPLTGVPENRPGPAADVGEVTRLLLLRGIFNGVTSGLSRTGSTSAVRPLAPRHPGREDVKAPAAGSMWCSTVSGFLSTLPDCAIRLTLSPNEVIAEVGLFCGGVDDALMPSPRANSAGLTCDVFPVALFVGSPVMVSQRTSPFCWPCRCVDSRSAASDCFRRARRRLGILDRDCAAPSDCWASMLSLAFLEVPWDMVMADRSSSIGETSRDRPRGTP